jgi:peptidoglycan/LPS O-acetylase OafA/YrhL
MIKSSILQYNRQIDGLRCVAVLGVLVHHFIRFDNVYLNRFPFGQGVNLFFVISGYLITKILLLNKYRVDKGERSIVKVLKSFYFRRTLRIFPIYYLTIFYLLAIDFQNTKDVFVWLVSYTTNFYISIDSHPYIGSFNHLWSLAVEEQFYLLWPMMILLIPQKYIEKSIVAIIFLSLGFKIYYFAHFGYSTAINALTISCADSLGFGALIAYWSLNRPKLISKINRFRFSVPVSFLPFVFFIIYPAPYVNVILTGNNFLFSFFAFFVVLRASEMKFSSLTKFLLENRLAVHIGIISYGIYLYHFFMPDFYNILIEWFPQTFQLESSFRTIFLFISAIAFAELSWIVVERPLMKFKDRYKYSG